MDIKVPLYNVLNFLLTGFVFIGCLLLMHPDIVRNFIMSEYYNRITAMSETVLLLCVISIAYEIGFVLNRTGSVIVEPILKKTKIVPTALFWMPVMVMVGQRVKVGAGGAGSRRARTLGAGTVTGILHGLDDLGRAGGALHAHGVGQQAHRTAGNAGHLAHGLLHPGGAGCAAHAGDVEVHLLRRTGRCGTRADRRLRRSIRPGGATHFIFLADNFGHRRDVPCAKSCGKDIHLQKQRRLHASENYSYCEDIPWSCFKVKSKQSFGALWCVASGDAASQRSSFGTSGRFKQKNEEHAHC